jgi:hypothetical protein
MRNPVMQGAEVRRLAVSAALIAVVLEVLALGAVIDRLGWVVA